MRRALGTLPWVDQKSIKADIATKQVRFSVKDKSQFKLEDVQKALEKENFSGVTLKSGPT
ncbi:MAG TPA: hypothetical protein VKI65_16760 [Gemmataceae bacterium]|nr:hypothetical protein [Gemmataceae bacterium]